MLFGVFAALASVSPDLKLTLNSLALAIPAALGFFGGLNTYIRHRGNSSPVSIGRLSLGLGLGFTGIGEVTYNLLDRFLGEGHPSHLWSDGLYFLGYAFLIHGLVTYTGAFRSERVRQPFIDGIFLICCGLTSGWKLLIEPALLEQSGSISDRLITLAYPVASVLILAHGLSLMGLSMRDSFDRKSMLLIGPGLVISSICDLVWVAQEQSGSYINAGFFDVGWVIAYGMIAAGLFVPADINHESRASHLGSQVVSWLGSMLPLLAAALGAGYFAAQELMKFGSLGLTSMLGLLFALALVVVRQFFGGVETKEFFSSTSQVLEEKFQSSTRLLQARYKMAKVNSAADLEEFLETAATSVDQALDSDGVIVSIRSGLVQAYPSGKFVCKEFGQEVAPVIEHELVSHDALVSVEPVRLLIGEVWRVATVLRVPLRAMNEVFGAVFAIRIEQQFNPEEREQLESMALELASALGHVVMVDRAVESAQRDYLTETLNHRAISEKLQEYITHQAKLGIILADVGGFKLFNDTYGHAAGDDLLRCVASHMTQAVQHSGGIVGRTGGDEFLILLPGQNMSDTYRIANELQTALNQVEFQLAGYKERLPVAINVGLASYPQSGDNSTVLLKVADKNLHEAKRNRVYLYDPREEEAKRAQRSHSLDALEMMLTAIDNMDQYTRVHSEDVARFAAWLAEEIGCSSGTLAQVNSAARLHDIGKIAVPADILRKPGMLEPDELEVMKQHPRIGAMIVKAMPNMNEIVDGVLYHHERYDGLGYPEGLVGNEIPFLGRLLAVADAFSAMVTDRAYRKGMSWDEAAMRIRDGIGTHFDPDLAEAFLRVLEARGVQTYRDRAA